MKIGRQSMKFNQVYITGTGNVVGVKEGMSPLKEYFDLVLDDDYFGEKTWERAESKMLKTAIETALKKTGLKPKDIDFALSGDLLNQCVGSNYAMRDIKIPFLGLYGACTTMVESMIIGSVMVDGGCAQNVICSTSSHFCSAEKQFRFPLDYGGQRPPYSQWTVTGSGCAVLTSRESKVSVFSATVGNIVDLGISDLNNMGSAMAPAAYDTIKKHLEDFNIDINYYNRIYTGDLGIIGSDILLDMLNKSGIDAYSMHRDCGKMIYDTKIDDVHSGGSGAGCIASVFTGKIYKDILGGKIKRALVVGTGALMNSAIVGQGETIPVIAHAIGISGGE